MTPNQKPNQLKAVHNKILIKKLNESVEKSGLIYLPEISSSRLNTVYKVVSIGSDLKAKGFKNPNSPYKKETVKLSKNLIENKSKVMLNFTPVADQIRYENPDNPKEYDEYYSVNPWNITIILNY